MRPIDADALMKRLVRKRAEPCNKRFTEGFNDALMRFRSMVSTEPTITRDDVCGVGKWIDKPYFTECSVCHAEFDSEVTCSEIYGWPWVHCPKCGAKMEVSA